MAYKACEEVTSYISSIKTYIEWCEEANTDWLEKFEQELQDWEERH